MSKYIVALEVGGLMEMPLFEYKNAQIIEASSQDAARETYNRNNNCSYFYGTVIGVIYDGKPVLSERFISHTLRKIGLIEDGKSN